jgi:hypothetical protein
MEEVPGVDRAGLDLSVRTERVSRPALPEQLGLGATPAAHL